MQLHGCSQLLLERLNSTSSPDVEDDCIRFELFQRPILDLHSHERVNEVGADRCLHPDVCLQYGRRRRQLHDQFLRLRYGTSHYYS